ncbi:X8 domain, partial [Dillenia turbinata]
MKLLGFDYIEIVIAEMDAGQIGVGAESAAEYNGNLMKHVMSGNGTPLVPNRTSQTCPVCEKNSRLFKPNLIPGYDIVILRPPVAFAENCRKLSLLLFILARTGLLPSNPSPTPVQSDGKQSWCLPKTGVKTEDLQRNIDSVCGLGIEYCREIQEGGQCFLPNTVQAHAAYAMNAYYQTMGRHDFDCDFAH